MQFYILFPIILRFLSKSMIKRPFVVLSVAFFVQGIILLYGFFYIKPTDNLLLGFFNDTYYKSVFGWFFYFLLGGTLAYHYQRVVDFINKYIKFIFLGYLISTVLFVGVVYRSLYIHGGRHYYLNYASIRPDNMIYSVFTLAILIWASIKIKNYNNGIVKFIKSVGTYSFGVYFAHPLVLSQLRRILIKLYPSFIGYGRIRDLIVLLVLAFIGTMLICYLSSLSKYRMLLMGKVPQLKISIEEVKKTGAGTAINLK